VSTAIAYADAALAVAKRDILVFRSYRLRFAGQMLRAFFSVALFYYISRLVTVEPFGSPDEYFAFAVVGIVIMEVLFSTVTALPARVRQELVAGTFEKFVVSPFGAAAAVVSMTTFPFLLAFVNGLVTLTFAGIVFGMPVQWSTAALGLPLAILGCLSFAAFALLAAAAVILLKQAQSGIGFLMSGRIPLPGCPPARLDPVDLGRPAVHADPRAPSAGAGRHSGRWSGVGGAAQDRGHDYRAAAHLHLGAGRGGPEEPAPRDDHRVLTR
jgi:ABC-type transport system involved in cytochrome c biogenesis permease component